MHPTEILFSSRVFFELVDWFLFYLLFPRKLLRCTRRPTGHGSRLRKGRRAEVKAEMSTASGNPMAKGRQTTTSTPAKRRRKLNPPVQRGDPKLRTTPRGSVAKRLLLLGSR